MGIRMSACFQRPRPLRSPVPFVAAILLLAGLARAETVVAVSPAGWIDLIDPSVSFESYPVGDVAQGGSFELQLQILDPDGSQPPTATVALVRDDGASELLLEDEAQSIVVWEVLQDVGVYHLVATVRDAFGNGAQVEGGEFEIVSDQTVDASSIAQSFELRRAYPNPFNATTELAYSIPETGIASLAIVNLAGQTVRTLQQGLQEAGWHRCRFEATDLPTGLYFAVLGFEGRQSVVKLTLIK